MDNDKPRKKLALKSYPVETCYTSKTMDAIPQALQLVYQN